MDFGKGQRIWIKVSLKDKYQRSCKNEILKKKKEFYVRKSASTKNGYDWDFNVFLDNDGCGKDDNILSELNAVEPGRCNLVETFDTVSRGCGLATSLLEICFEDENVGTIDPETDLLFQDKQYFGDFDDFALLVCFLYITLTFIHPDDSIYQFCFLYK